MTTKKGLVLIGDDSLHYGRICARLLQEAGLRVVLTPNDGVEIFRAIRRREPDIVLMDYFAPHIDAVGMFAAVESLSRRKPNFILTSAREHPYLSDAAKRLGAVAFKQIPFDVKALCADILEMMEKFSDGNRCDTHSGTDTSYLEYLVTREIRKLGMPAHLKGYHYVRELLVFILQRSGSTDVFTNSLYSVVAERFKVTPSRIERAIRNAIDHVWNGGNYESLLRYFPNVEIIRENKPTNMEFLMTVAEELRFIIAHEGDVTLKDHTL